MSLESEPLAQLGEINRLQSELDALRAKLDASERACAEMRVAVEGCNEMFDTYGHTSESPCQRDRDIIATMLHSLSSDAGRDYMPRSEVDAAWRKGMSDAANIAKMLEPDDAHNAPHNVLTSDAIIAARDAKPTSEPPRSQQGQDSQHEHPPR